MFMGELSLRRVTSNLDAPWNHKGDLCRRTGGRTKRGRKKQINEYLGESVRIWAAKREDKMYIEHDLNIPGYKCNSDDSCKHK